MALIVVFTLESQVAHFFFILFLLTELKYFDASMFSAPDIWIFFGVFTDPYVTIMEVCIPILISCGHFALLQIN